jgi:hypothetical protein
LPAFPRRSGNLFYGGHLVLALSLCFWRGFESLPGWSTADGGSFTGSSTGRLLGLATLSACLLGALVIVAQSLRRWRDPRVCLLALALVLALASRQSLDLFDFVYAGLAIGLALWWFRTERRSTQVRA